MEPNQSAMDIITSNNESIQQEKMDMQEPDCNNQETGGAGSYDYVYNKDLFAERSFHEDLAGYYDENYFFHTPEGSFFNEEHEYFNRFGFDRYGGQYNRLGLYIPGEGWNEDFQCYQEDLLSEEMLKQQIDQVDYFFEEQMKIDICSLQDRDEDDNEEEKSQESSSKNLDFLKVKDAMEAEAREEASRTASAVKNASENFPSKSAAKSAVAASASKILNNNLIGDTANASHVNASALKNDFNNNNNNFTKNVSNFSLNNDTNGINSNSHMMNNTNNLGFSQRSNLQLNTEGSENVPVSNNLTLIHAGTIDATGAENIVNVGIIPTPMKSNYVHEPTPFKVMTEEGHDEENKI